MTPPPRRIGELVLVIDMPREVRPQDRARLEEVARNCPVARSLHPDVWSPLEFRYPALSRPASRPLQQPALPRLPPRLLGGEQATCSCSSAASSW